MSITHLWPLMGMPQSVFSSLRAGGLCMAGTGRHGNTLLLPQHHSLTAKSGDQWPWASEDPMMTTVHFDSMNLTLHALETQAMPTRGQLCVCNLFERLQLKSGKTDFHFFIFKNYKYNAFVWPAEAKPPPVIETWTLTWVLSEWEAIYCAPVTRGSPKNVTKKAKVAERERSKR